MTKVRMMMDGEGRGEKDGPKGGRKRVEEEGRVGRGDYVRVRGSLWEVGKGRRLWAERKGKW